MTVFAPKTRWQKAGAKYRLVRTELVGEVRKVKKGWSFSRRPIPAKGIVNSLKQAKLIVEERAAFRVPPKVADVAPKAAAAIKKAKAGVKPKAAKAAAKPRASRKVETPTLTLDHLLTEAESPNLPRFGEHKVFLGPLLARFGTTPQAAAAELVRWQQAGKLTLSRADLVAAMPAELVASSEFSPPGFPSVTYHFLTLSERKPRAVAADAKDVEEAILKSLRERANEGLSMVRDVRRDVGAPKTVFDDAALRLNRAGRVVMHFHDYPAGETPETREAWVLDRNGTYYHAIALPNEERERVTHGARPSARGAATVSDDEAKELALRAALAVSPKLKTRVRLADVRKQGAFSELSHDQQTRALLALQDDGRAVLYRNDNPRELTKADEAAQIDAGGFPRHLIYIESEEQPGLDLRLLALSIRDRGTGLTFVPKLVALLKARGVKNPQALILEAAERGEVELRPEGGIQRLSKAELAASIPGPQGTRLSWLRVPT